MAKKDKKTKKTSTWRKEMNKKTEEMFPNVDFRKLTPSTINDLIHETISNKLVYEKVCQINGFLDRETSLTPEQIHDVFIAYLRLEIKTQISLAVKSKNWNFIFFYGTAVEKEVKFPLHNHELLEYPDNHKYLAFNVFRANIHPTMIIKHME